MIIYLHFLSFPIHYRYFIIVLFHTWFEIICFHKNFFFPRLLFNFFGLGCNSSLLTDLVPLSCFLFQFSAFSPNRIELYLKFMQLDTEIWILSRCEIYLYNHYRVNLVSTRSSLFVLFLRWRETEQVMVTGADLDFKEKEFLVLRIKARRQNPSYFSIF